MLTNSRTLKKHFQRRIYGKSKLENTKMYQIPLIKLSRRTKQKMIYFHLKKKIIKCLKRNLVKMHLKHKSKPKTCQIRLKKMSRNLLVKYVSHNLCLSQSAVLLLYLNRWVREVEQNRLCVYVYMFLMFTLIVKEALVSKNVFEKN